MILVLGNYLRTSSAARLGDIKGCSVSAEVPRYESKHILRNGQGKMGSSNARRSEGVKLFFDMLRAGYARMSPSGTL